jgi:hypothetical protein
MEASKRQLNVTELCEMGISNFRSENTFPIYSQHPPKLHCCEILMNSYEIAKLVVPYPKYLHGTE